MAEEYSTLRSSFKRSGAQTMQETKKNRKKPHALSHFEDSIDKKAGYQRDFISVVRVPVSSPTQWKLILAAWEDHPLKLGQ